MYYITSYIFLDNFCTIYYLFFPNYGDSIPQFPFSYFPFFLLVPKEEVLLLNCILNDFSKNIFQGSSILFKGEGRGGKVSVQGREKFPLFPNSVQKEFKGIVYVKMIKISKLKRRNQGHINFTPLFSPQSNIWVEDFKRHGFNVQECILTLMA